MSTPIVNQSENEMKIRVETYHYVFSTEETNINSNARLITVAGLGGLRERDIVEISLAFFHPATPAQIKKGDVLKINDLGDVLVDILYAFEGAPRFSRATEGHLTVENIDLSVPYFNGRFEFSGPYLDGVGKFHGTFRTRE